MSMKHHELIGRFPDGSRKHYYNGSRSPSHFSLKEEVVDVAVPLGTLLAVGALTAGAVSLGERLVDHVDQDNSAAKSTGGHLGQPTHPTEVGTGNIGGNKITQRH